MPFARLRRAVDASRSRIGAQDGSMLIEVLVGAIVLALVTAAVLDGLDGAQATGRKNKDRSVAATLAQQDIERLRALPIPALVGLSESRLVDVNGVDYTVTSNTTWMRDDSGELSCTDDTTQASYLKVVSSSWSPASSDQPVAETTLITPPTAFSATTGTATVKTTDLDGNPLAGVTIRLAGPASYTAATNTLGCAIFSFIEPGEYTATVDGNYVERNSVTPVEEAVTVVAGKTTPVQIELAQPASLRIHFKSHTGASVDWKEASVPHPDLDGGFKVFGTETTFVPTVDALGLFPQKGGYNVYAGGCESNNPANPWWGDPKYFASHPESHADVAPGSSLVPVDAVMPVLQVTVSKQRRQRVYLQVDQTDNPSGDVDCRLDVYDRDAGIWIDRASQSDQSVETVGPIPLALPFGNYTVCVDDGRTSSSSGTRRFSQKFSMTEPQDYTFNPELAPQDTGSSGECPNVR